MILDALIPWSSKLATSPHTIASHSLIISLVFMGSEKYPYKGIIDHLANRGYSNGTNAWTDTDHTARTTPLMSLIVV